MSTQTQQANALLALLALAGCADPDTARPVVRGQWVQVQTDPEIQICGGQLAVYDRFVEEVPQLFDTTVPEDFYATLHAFTEASRDETPQADKALAGVTQAQGTDAWIFFQLADLHELSHTVVIALLGPSITPLAEGAAQGLSPGRVEAQVYPPSIPLAELLLSDFPEFNSTSYANAALFFRYVLDTYGPQIHRKLHQGLAGRPTNGEIRSRIETLLGETIEAVDADYSAEIRCGYQLPFCGDALPVQSLPIVIDERFDCEADDTLGFLGPDPTRFVPYRVLPFDIADGTTLPLVASAARWSLRRCGDCSEQMRSGYDTAPVGETVDQSDTGYEFPGGRYFVIVEAVDPDVPVQFRLGELP